MRAMDPIPPQPDVVSFAHCRDVILEMDVIALVEEHRRRLVLCRQAEAIADGLPDHPGRAAMTKFLHGLDALAMDSGDGGGGGMDAIAGATPDDRLPATLLGHIRRRHMADVAAARELVAVFGETDAFDAPDTLGRLLRTFSTRRRRTIDFEQLTVLALAGHHLTPDARNVLIDTLAYSLLE